ncbi:MAG: hypothetical protein ACO1NO_01540 [Burkholderiaceae bacterium]
MRHLRLFILAKIALIIVLTFVAERAGFGAWMQGQALDLGSVFLFAALLILFGLIIPAAFSKWVTKRAMFSRSIVDPRTPSETWLVDTVRRHASFEGIKPPEIAVYDSLSIHAYAAGLDRDEALLAVSSALLADENRKEAETLLQRKVRQVARGDMLIPLFFSLLACWLLVRLPLGA